MYAVIKTGGKQYRVAVGDKLKVEKLVAEVGSQVVLDKVLMLTDGEVVRLGAPLVAGATVQAEVLSHGRGDKIIIFKMRRRKHYRKTQGHRQSYTELKVSAIQSDGAKKSAAASASGASATTEAEAPVVKKTTRVSKKTD